MRSHHHPHHHRPDAGHQHHPGDALAAEGRGADRHEGFGPGGHRGPRGHRGGGRGRGRASRGDVQAAILLLLTEEPMHGYQLMQAIADRSGGRWTPSPGAVYPAISQLEDLGLVVVSADAGRKTVTLTDAGREHIEAQREGWGDPFTSDSDLPAGPDLRQAVMALHDAARQVGRSGTPAQVATAATIVSEARRALYLLLAEVPAAGDE